MSWILVSVLTAGLSLQVTQQDATKPAMTDADFIMKTAESGMKEVQIAQLASEKASNADVKAFARRLVVDHSMLNEELAKLAKSKNVTLKDDPTKPMKSDPSPATKPDPAAAHEPMNHMKTLDGAAFDRAFIDHMVKGHEASIERFEKARDTKDESLEDWIEKKLPALKEHLKIAKDLQGKISVR